MARVYRTLDYPKAKAGDSTFLTGVRALYNRCDKVYITGVLQTAEGQSSGLLFRGSPIVKKHQTGGEGKWFNLNFPSSELVQVTATSIYGPNALKDNRVEFVGNYKTASTGPADLGFYYKGKPDGSGHWRTLVPTSKKPVLNVIAHSTMGGFVVGNYDTGLAGKAFIYNIKQDKYFDIKHKGAVSITAYGIWHDGGHLYTIAGGYTDIHGKNFAYLAKWDAKQAKIVKFAKYQARLKNKTARVTHFNGITGDGCGGYHLTGDLLEAELGKSNAFYAHVDAVGSEAKWEIVSYPKAFVTSGNTIFTSTVIGVYSKEGEDVVHGYLAYRAERKH